MARARFEFMLIHKNWVVLLILVLFTQYSCNKQRNSTDAPSSQTYASRTVDSLNKKVNYFRDRDLDSALFLANQAREISRRIGYQRGEAIAIAKISSLYRQLEQYDTALLLTQESHSIRELLGDAKLIAGSHNHFTSVFIELEQFEKAMEHVLKSLEISRNLDDSSGIFHAHNQMGIIFGITDDQVKSKQSFLKAYSIATSTNDLAASLKSRENLGVAYTELEQYDSAYFYLQSNLVYYQNHGMLNYVAGIQTNLGNVLIELGRNKEAITMLNSAYKNAIDLGNNQFISTSLNAIKIFYRNRQQTDSAYKYLNLYTNHKRNTYQTSLAEGIATAQVKFETEKVELENKHARTQIKKDSKIKVILFITLGIILLVALVIVRYVQQKRKLAEVDLQLQKQKIDSLLRNHEMKTFETMVDVQEEERKRIAEDLHDRLGSILTAVKLHFNAIEEGIQSDPTAAAQAKKANEMLDIAADEVRSISHDMLSNVLVRFGLVAALQDLQETIALSSQIEIEVYEHGLSQRLENKVEIAIYRIIQELISNILKHAKANKITIDLNMNAGLLNIIVHDDGIGFKPDKSLSMGVGLQNIQKRLITIQGEMTIDSKPNQGTSTIIDIQINPNHD
jgi:two-component system, NarL family, sensor kinase